MEKATLDLTDIIEGAAKALVQKATGAAMASDPKDYDSLERTMTRQVQSIAEKLIKEREWDLRNEVFRAIRDGSFEVQFTVRIHGADFLDSRATKELAEPDPTSVAPVASSR